MKKAYTLSKSKCSYSTHFAPNKQNIISSNAKNLLDTSHSPKIHQIHPSTIYSNHANAAKSQEIEVLNFQNWLTVRIPRLNSIMQSVSVIRAPNNIQVLNVLWILRFRLLHSPQMGIRASKTGKESANFMPIG